MKVSEITNDLLDRALSAYWDRDFPGSATPTSIYNMRHAMRDCLEMVISELAEIIATDGVRIRMREKISGPAIVAQQLADKLKELVGGKP